MVHKVECMPAEKVLLRFDGVLAPLYNCMTGVHQHAVPSLWGIVLIICYMYAATTDFLEFERRLERPIEFKCRRLSLFLNPRRSVLRWQDIKLLFDTALINI